APVLAQEKKTDEWERKKSQRFKPIDSAKQQQIFDAVPDSATAKPKKQRRVLAFYRCEGFIHTSIPHCNAALRAMGDKTKAFQVDFADTYDVFTAENLKRYDAVLLNNTTHMKFPTPTHRDAFLDFVVNGGGLAGFHAASDNFNKTPRALEMIGGTFAGHPWGAGGTWAFKLDDPGHVLNAAFEKQGFWHRDEIYQYRPDSYVGTENLRILVSLDMTKDAVSGRINDGPREVPVSWIRTAAKGRVFYTNLGHREETFRNPVMLRHMLDGLQYALGDLPADATPTAVAGEKSIAFAPEKQ
ncbi:MAG: ThuA domain-containing protein, partial [Planctomycetota bacterium]